MRKRSGRPSRFAAVPNETIDDATNLDFMALSLLVVLLRHRDGWEVTLAEIGKKYGYGRDAMANAMGALQVARYVIKIRIMSAVGNLWSTELYVYDTPASTTEVSDLLASVADDSAVRRVEVIQPTTTALERAEKRRSKLGGRPLRRKTTRAPTPVPRVPESLHSDVTSENTHNHQVGSDCRITRQPGGSALSKKTVVKEHRENTASVPPSVLRGSNSPHRGSVAEATTGPSNHTAPTARPHNTRENHETSKAHESEGTRLLKEMARRQPQLALEGKVLTDQAARLDELLKDGYNPTALLIALCAKAPEVIHISPGAVVSARISSILTRSPVQVPQTNVAASVWHPQTEGWKTTLELPVTPADRPLSEAMADHGVMPECAECGRPGLEQGEVLCPQCLGWPECTTCTSLTPRRANPLGNGQCSVCLKDITL
ncbi:hypothetical protein ACIGW8_34200 [Streptomyces sioyaensis]|uniref:hypothetical protein n=1 Tax=Streptomyces sioyaensis TaxID=67364 RepID=UPI0037D0D994